MKKLIDIIFKNRDNDNFNTAKEKLNYLKEFLEHTEPKLIRFKEIYITEIHF